MREKRVKMPQEIARPGRISTDRLCGVTAVRPDWPAANPACFGGSGGPGSNDLRGILVVPQLGHPPGANGPPLDLVLGHLAPGAVDNVAHGDIHHHVIAGGDEMARFEQSQCDARFDSAEELRHAFWAGDGLMPRHLAGADAEIPMSVGSDVGGKESQVAGAKAW